MPAIIDQLARVVHIPENPDKIISLVPSQTELLFDLGLNKNIVGITKFCIYPANKVAHKIKVGGTKQLNISLIRSLKPNLIIANKEENERGQLEILMQEYPTYISNPANLNGALAMIADIGQITNRETQAKQLTDAIAVKFERLQTIRHNTQRVAYLIWREPYMAAGQDTFINGMLQACGLENAINAERYPQLTANELQKANPDTVLLSSEPYPFNTKHIAEIKQVLPRARVLLANGEFFSWYGSRLLHAPEYFISLINSLNAPIM